MYGIIYNLKLWNFYSLDVEELTGNGDISFFSGNKLEKLSQNS